MSRKPELIAGAVIAGITTLVVSIFAVADIGTPSSQTDPPLPAHASSTPSKSTPAPSPTPTIAAEKGSVLYALHNLWRNGNPQPIGGYDRDKFGQKWADVDDNGCDQRDDVLRRDMRNLHTKPGTDGCVLAKGTLSLKGDSYAAKRVKYTRGDGEIEIDHVVSLADAWEAGAHEWSKAKWEKFANDFMNLEAVDAATSRDKGDNTADHWLPADEDDQCALVVRQISIKHRYELTVRVWEQQAMDRVLHLPGCDGAELRLLKAKDFMVPKPKPIGEPKPKPKPTPERSTEPEEPSEPSVRRGVHPGAFCSPAGAPGVTSKGTPMICKGPGQPRWRAR